MGRRLGDNGVRCRSVSLGQNSGSPWVTTYSTSAAGWREQLDNARQAEFAEPHGLGRADGLKSDPSKTRIGPRFMASSGRDCGSSSGDHTLLAANPALARTPEGGPAVLISAFRWCRQSDAIPHISGGGAPSPECLQDRGGFTSTRADVSRRTELRNPSRVRPLSPKVTRCHQVRNTRF